VPCWGMAIFSLNHQPIGRSTHKAGTAGAHIGYIARSSAARKIIGQHMPIPAAGTRGGKAREWMDAQEESDRKNARVIDKLRISIPHELSADQREQAVTEFVAELTGGNVPWIAALHDLGKDAANPHVHLVIRDRHFETGKRVAQMSEKGSTEKARQVWQEVANRALEAAGADARIDRRSLRAQRAEALEKADELRDANPALADLYQQEAKTLDRRPQVHRGPAVSRIVQRGERSTVVKRAEMAREGSTAKRLTGRVLTSVGLKAPKPAPSTPEDTRRASAARRSAVEAHRAAEAARRQEEAVEARREALDRLAAITLPYVQLARLEKSLHKLIERFGIRMKRPDADVARDLRWLNQMSDDGPWPDQAVHEIVARAYAPLSRAHLAKKMGWDHRAQQPAQDPPHPKKEQTPETDKNRKRTPSPPRRRFNPGSNGSVEP